MIKKPELLSPAGTPAHMEYAFAFGADAVYAGLPRYSLRARNNTFDRNNIQKGIVRAHELGKLFFLTCNLFPHGSKLRSFMKDVKPFVELKPDAMIMADPGLIMMVREEWPELPIHLSVQSNTVNAASVKFWQKQGLKRIILSRELTLSEVEEIRQACPDMELEVFVHGALCVAYSGRCLLSGYMSNRDANQGICTNACRWEYRVKASPTSEDPAQNLRHSAADEPWLLEEKERPGEFMTMYEDDQGTYIMNSRDLCALEHVERLMNIGVDSLKIEGRTKSIYYVARTARAYRKAIDDAALGKPMDPSIFQDLGKLANRGYTGGFYERKPHADFQAYSSSASTPQSHVFVGEVIDYDSSRGLATIDVKNRFEKGDRIEIISPKTSQNLLVDELLDQKGNRIEVAPGNGWKVRISVAPLQLPALITKSLSS